MNTTTPTSDQVAAVIDTIRGWSAVTPLQRADLRSAVAALDVDEPAFERPRPGPPDFVLNTAEVADRLRVSQATVRSLIDSGALAGFRLRGDRGDYRVRTSALEAYLAASRIEAS